MTDEVNHPSHYTAHPSGVGRDHFRGDTLMASRSINPPETAPKDQQIMADFGWPWLQPAIWCSVTEQWATAQYNSCEHSGEWYETEWYSSFDLRGWIPYPQALKPDSAEEYF